MRKFLVVMSVFLMLGLSIIGLVGCGGDTCLPRPGDYTGNCSSNMDVKSFDNLKIIFGEDYIYPVNADDLFDFAVYSDPGGRCQPGSINDTHRNKVTYIDFLCCATWQYIANNGVTVTAKISKSSGSHSSENLAHNFLYFPSWVFLASDEPVEGIDYYMLDDLRIYIYNYEGASNLMFVIDGYSYIINAGDCSGESTATKEQLDAYLVAMKQYVETFVEPII